MADIPTIPGSAFIDTQTIGTKIDPRHRLAVIGATADTISQGLEVVGEYEEKKQKAEEIAAFNNASIVLNKTTADYQHRLKTIPDQQIVPQWSEIATKTKDGLLQGTHGWTPASRAKFQQHLDSWQSDSTIQFQVAGDHLASQRRKATATAAATEFLQSGDETLMPNAVSAIHAAVDAGDMAPEEGKAMIAQFPRTLQENQIRNGMEADPVATLKDINEGHFKDVPPMAMATLKRQVTAAIARQQNDGRDDVLRRLDAGEPIEESELKMKEDAKVLSPAGAKSIRARIAQKNLAEAKDDHAIQMMDVQDHDFTLDKDPDTTAQHMKDRAAALPLTLRVSVNQAIDTRLKQAKKAGAAEERPVERDIFSRGKKDYADGLFQAPTQEDVIEEVPHWWRPNEQKVVGQQTRQPKPDTQWETMATPQERATAALNYAKWQDKMRSFFKANPEAKSEEAEAYSQSILAPHVEAQVKEALSPKAPLIPAKGMKVQQDGKTYEFDGTNWAESTP